ncbi:MAG: Crp/Fnr family transcriptional regulator [Spirochaetes bacterium]|nr:MAG: Crp/Fnr family transcriptional regulator [Spirochaetota bacterium]
MSPKAVQYKANSIIYFKGDLNDKIFILKSGRVCLKSNDIETGQELQEMIQTGEFFGVKSALGKYPKEETALVLQDSQVVVFTVPEFEQLASQNTRIIMKMLKVFSNQLRRIHKQVQNLLSAEDQGENPETGLFKIGEHYFNVKKFPQALYAFRRYLTYYPSGAYAEAAARNIEQLEMRIQGHPARSTPASTASPVRSRGEELSEAAKKYYNAVSLFSQQKYNNALNEFRNIVTQGADEEYTAKSVYEIGRCLYYLQNYDECIKHFTAMIQKYPKHQELLDALYYLGKCYEKKGEKKRAGSFYNKIMSMGPTDSPVYIKAKKASRNL